MRNKMLYWYFKNQKSPENAEFTGLSGTLEGIRTPDLLVRSQTLYPTELPAQISKNIKLLSICTQIDHTFRSQTLYPTELPARRKNIHMYI